MKEVRKRAGSTMNKVSQYQVLPYRGTKLHRLRTPISPPDKMEHDAKDWKTTHQALRNPESWRSNVKSLLQ